MNIIITGIEINGNNMPKSQENHTRWCPIFNLLRVDAIN
jgi:hypothetical protein